MPKSLDFDDLGGFFQLSPATNSIGNIPTGHFALDFGLHFGMNPENVDLAKLEGYDPSKPLGLPLGKIIEIYGEEGSGKSSLAYRVCGFAQKLGYKAVWIDAEQSFSENLAEINGIDRSQLVYSDLSNIEKPDLILTAEDVMDNIIKICKDKGRPDSYFNDLGVIVVDSVASLTTKQRMEADADQNTVGDLARVLSNNLKKIANYASKNQICVIFINQVREKIGVLFGNPETTPGGRALKFNASVRLGVSKKSGKEGEIVRKDESGDEILIGGKANVKIVKNRFSKPYRDPKNNNRITIPIYYETYFPEIEEIMFDVGRQLKIIKIYKSELRWKEQDIAVSSRDDFIDTLKFKGLINTLLLEIKKEASSQNVVLPPELSLKIIDVEKEMGQSELIDGEESETDGDEKSTSRGRKKKVS